MQGFTKLLGLPDAIKIPAGVKKLLLGLPEIQADLERWKA